MDDLWVQQINMPNTFSRQSKTPSEELNRAAAHYSLIGRVGGVTQTHSHLYYPGSVEKGGAGVEHEQKEMLGVREQYQTDAAHSRLISADVQGHSC